jgi:hypothetical protein
MLEIMYRYYIMSESAEYNDLFSQTAKKMMGRRTAEEQEEYEDRQAEIEDERERNPGLMTRVMNKFRNREPTPIGGKKYRKKTHKGGKSRKTRKTRKTARRRRHRRARG